MIAQQIKELIKTNEVRMKELSKYPFDNNWAGSEWTCLKKTNKSLRTILDINE